MHMHFDRNKSIAGKERQECKPRSKKKKKNQISNPYRMAIQSTDTSDKKGGYFVTSEQ